MGRMCDQLSCREPPDARRFQRIHGSAHWPRAMPAGAGRSSRSPSVVKQPRTAGWSRVSRSCQDFGSIAWARSWRPACAILDTPLLDTGADSRPRSRSHDGSRGSDGRMPHASPTLRTNFRLTLPAARRVAPYGSVVRAAPRTGSTPRAQALVSLLLGPRQPMATRAVAASGPLDRAAAAAPSARDPVPGTRCARRYSGVHVRRSRAKL